MHKFPFDMVSQIAFFVKYICFLHYLSIFISDISFFYGF